MRHVVWWMRHCCPAHWRSRLTFSSSCRMAVRVLASRPTPLPLLCSPTLGVELLLLRCNAPLLLSPLCLPLQPRLHPSLQATFDAAAHTYAVKRKPRHLKPVSSQGFVSLQVEVEGAGGEAGLRDIVCSVPQASALLWAMDAMRDDAAASVGDSPAACSLAALAASLAVSAQLTLQLASFWVRLGVLRLQTRPGAGPCVVMAAAVAADAGTAQGGAAEEGEAAATEAPGAEDDDDESETAGAVRARSDDDENAAAAAEAAASASSSGDPPEAVATWTGFVSGMLTNLGALPLERIHAMLQMFAGMGEHPCECGGTAEGSQQLCVLACPDVCTCAFR